MAAKKSWTTVAEISFHVLATLCLSERARSSIIQTEPGLKEVDRGGSGITSDPESCLAFLLWGFPCRGQPGTDPGQTQNWLEEKHIPFELFIKSPEKHGQRHRAISGFHSHIHLSSHLYQILLFWNFTPGGYILTKVQNALFHSTSF